MSDNLELIFHKPGLQTSIQDNGRPGKEAFGVPVSGAMDHISYRIANWLVDNNPGEPVLEVTLIGPEIEFTNDCQIALTGANLSAMINGKTVNQFCTIDVKKGSVLSFKKAISGCRSYLAVRGEWQVKKWLGSASTSVHPIETLNDNFIKKDSIVSISAIPAIKKRTYQSGELNGYAIRVVPGPEYDMFDRNALANFFKSEFKITNDSNRMGYRLDKSIYDKNSEIISSAVIPGTIQITNSGYPIILMADAQTTGGYARIANVVTPDLDKLAQLKPCDTIKFELISHLKGQELVKEYYELFM